MTPAELSRFVRRRAAALTRHRRPQGGDPRMLGLTFQVAHRFRPVELVSSGFTLLDEPEPASLSSLVKTSAAPAAPFAAVELSVLAGTGGGVVLGVFGDDGDHVVVVCSPSERRVSIEVRHGDVTYEVASRQVELPTPARVGFAVCENQVTALIESPHGWRPLLTNRRGVAELIDLRVEQRWRQFRLGYGPHQGAEPAGTVRVAAVRAGAFGMTGVRDPHLVQRPDGSPYIRDGKVYLTFTCAGLGFFQQAHFGVFTLDLEDPTQLNQVAQLYTRRDGLLLGDHAGQVIVDEEWDRFLVLTSSWGDFASHGVDGVHVRHTATSADVLTGTHLLETVRLPLPTQVGSWDPAATLIDDRWHVGFVESPSQGDPFDFHPALAVGAPGAAFTEGLELVGADTSLHQSEGPILAQVDGRWYLLASDGDAREYPVYDLQMRRLGVLDAPYGTNIPHPQLIERPGGGYWMVSFDGTQFGPKVMGYGGHGDVVILSSR